MQPDGNSTETEGGGCAGEEGHALEFHPDKGSSDAWMLVNLTNINQKSKMRH